MILSKIKWWLTLGSTLAFLICAFYWKQTHLESPSLEFLSDLNFLDQELLKKGFEEIKAHKVLFLGISRDNAHHFPVMKKHIEELGNCFQDYRAIFFENDSTDATKMQLLEWSKTNSKIEVISQDFHLEKRPSIEFLAHCRNRTLEKMHNKIYQDYDIVIVLDMDLPYGIDFRGIASSFYQIHRWDVVTSNGVFENKKMYDAFAFRNEQFPYSRTEYHKISHSSYNSYLRSIQKNYSPQEDLISVYSAFGALGIYKRAAFEGCFYSSEQEDCEHVALHRCMIEKNNARIMMNPAQMIRYD